MTVRTLRNASDLVEAGLIAPERAAALERVAAQYAVAITPAMAELIDAADPFDPIARQFTPDVAELDILPVESGDPVGDFAHSPVEGVVHRYPHRAPLKANHACSAYCRLCFRRETAGPEGLRPLSPEAEAAVD